MKWKNEILKNHSNNKYEKGNYIRSNEDENTTTSTSNVELNDNQKSHLKDTILKEVYYTLRFKVVELNETTATPEMEGCNEDETIFESDAINEMKMLQLLYASQSIKIVFNILCRICLYNQKIQNTQNHNFNQNIRYCASIWPDSIRSGNRQSLSKRSLDDSQSHDMNLLEINGMNNNDNICTVNENNSNLNNDRVKKKKKTKKTSVDLSNTLNILPEASILHDANDIILSNPLVSNVNVLNESVGSHSQTNTPIKEKKKLSQSPTKNAKDSNRNNHSNATSMMTSAFDGKLLTTKTRTGRKLRALANTRKLVYWLTSHRNNSPTAVSVPQSSLVPVLSGRNNVAPITLSQSITSHSMEKDEVEKNLKPVNTAQVIKEVKASTSEVSTKQKNKRPIKEISVTSNSEGIACGPYASKKQRAIMRVAKVFRNTKKQAALVAVSNIFWKSPLLLSKS